MLLYQITEKQLPKNQREMIYGIERLAAHRQNQRRLFISGNRTRQYRIKNKDGQYEEAVA